MSISANEIDATQTWDGYRMPSEAKEITPKNVVKFIIYASSEKAKSAGCAEYLFERIVDESIIDERDLSVGSSETIVIGRDDCLPNHFDERA